MGNSMRTHNIRKVGSGAFGLAAVALLACTIFWPAWGMSTFHSRLAVGLFAGLCAASAFLLQPELSAGLAQGIREFAQASRQVIQEIRGNDDDDDPHAA